MTFIGQNLIFQNIFFFFFFFFLGGGGGAVLLTKIKNTYFDTVKQLELVFLDGLPS